MFRLISLNIDDQNYLGHIKEDKLIFVPQTERVETTLPYTSVLIGPNGTGKSTLLKYIGGIFEDIEYYRLNSKRRPGAIVFAFSIKYMIDSEVFIITQSKPKLDVPNIKIKEIHISWEYKISINETTVLDWSKVRTPSRIIAVSYLAMDRFRQKKNNIEDYYQYLGLRQRSNAASPSAFMNNTLPLLFSFINEKKSIEFLVETLRFMKMDSSYLGVQYEYRYKEYFFRKDLTVNMFKDLFGNYEKFSKREKTPFGVEYYRRHVAKNETLIRDIVTLLKTRSFDSQLLYGKRSLISFNLFDETEYRELELLYHLQKLDLISSLTLLFKKGVSGNEIPADKLSSGEFHFLTTMIAIQASIKDNALVLIDEPDTSLHPNWQMKYADNLKTIFRNWNSAHFILATHSHFIVSDLEGESSAVIGLTGQTPYVDTHLFDYNTYGWSAEEVLYKVFNLRSTRNFYFEVRIRELLHLISHKSKNKDRMTDLIEELSKSVLDKHDPLTQILKEANEYVRNM